MNSIRNNQFCLQSIYNNLTRVVQPDAHTENDPYVDKMYQNLKTLKSTMDDYGFEYRPQYTYNVIGTGDLHNLVFARCTTMEQADKIKEMVERAERFQGHIAVEKEQLQFDTYTLSGQDQLLEEDEELSR